MSQTPTVGRQLLFRPGNPRTHAFGIIDAEQPLTALVIFVAGPNSVTLSVTDHFGVRHLVDSCPVLQDGEAPNLEIDQAHWPEYQPPVVAAPVEPTPEPEPAPAEAQPEEVA